MQRMDRMFSGRAGGKLDGITSVVSGSVVVGITVAYAGLFLQVLAVVASFIYGTTFMLRMLTPRGKEGKPKDWG